LARRVAALELESSACHTGGMNWPRKINRIALTTLATALAILSVFWFPCARSSAAEAARSKQCRYQPIDDLGRCPRLSYKVVMSTDDRVCGTIASALTKAPSGERKLYSNPIFIPWHEGYFSHRPGVLPVAGWAIAPIFNDGQSYVLWKPYSEAPSPPRIFLGADGFERALAGDEPFGHELDPDPMLDVDGSARQVGVEVVRKVDGFPKLPSNLRKSSRWSAAARSNARDYQLVNLGGVTYLSARAYWSEIIYVVKFEQGDFADVCYLASNVWFESYANGKVVERREN
jgi:hypothetical protein